MFILLTDILALTRTEEMRPQWFRIPKDPAAVVDAVSVADDDLPTIPFDEMWGSDRFWIPLLLAKRSFIGRVDFGQPEEGKFNLLRWWFGSAEDASNMA